MRLIRYDDAIERLGAHLMANAQIDWGGTASTDIEEWKELADMILNGVPTIDAVEVVHGEWIYDANGYDYGLPAWKCNRCGCINANIPPRIMTKESKPNYAPVNPYAFSGSNYCPNCGARMKGADDE